MLVIPEHNKIEKLASIINDAFNQESDLNSVTVRDALKSILMLIEAGQLRVAEKINGAWIVNTWVKKAILLSFQTNSSFIMNNNYTRYFDKIPNKYVNYESKDFITAGVRVVPPAAVRYGTYIASGVVLMPSFINIGAYIGTGTMIDTWSTVGSCAQIGCNVHISGGVGIGGVLEPPQAMPTIIEDNCFIGARSELVEGIIVEEGSVIAMGVYIGQSTKIYNRMTNEITYGRIPSGSVVVPGALPASDGKHSVYCAVITKQVDAKTRNRVSINQLLRE